VVPVFKNYRKGVLPGLGNENGSAIIIALIVLVTLTILGIATSNISITELFISGNDVVKKISFFNADSGVFTVPKVISRAINDRKTPTSFSPPFVFIDDDAAIGDRTFYRELSGFEDPDDIPDREISFKNDGTNDTAVDIERLGSYTLVGGGAEFGSGAEGHSTSLKGIRFNLNSEGQGPKNALTNIQARYLKVLGTAGGL
jgi:hypothetical protein